MMTNEELLPLLLRAGLWGRAEEIPDQEYDLEAVRELSRTLAVSGIVADGIAAEKKAFPELPFAGEHIRAFIKETISVERTNARLDSLLVKVTELLESRGLRPVILKGQAMARLYPCPSHRTAGDIDILLDGDDYFKAAGLLVPKATGSAPEYPRIRHYGLFFGKLEVELHGTLHTRMGRGFNSLMDSLQREMFDKEEFCTFSIGDRAIRGSGLSFDATFIFLHIVQHLYDFGLSLKQLCDWAMLLHRNAGKIDLEQLRSRLENVGVMKEWKVLGCILTDFLGLPPEEVPFHEAGYSKEGRMLWKAIVSSNIYRGNGGRKQSYLGKKVVNTARRLSWIAGNLRIFPRNTIRTFFSLIASGTDSLLHGK
ncbi:MAG: nucleotidyltransferase family protein [Candidatus Cryptobacteroides sp.]